MNSAKLYEHALKDLGLREVAGSASSPRIRKAIDEAASWLDEDDSKTAWCGCILGLWCDEVKLPSPKERFRAKNWLNVGREIALADAVQGDIVVMTRAGGGHVTLFSGHQGNMVRCLGGNQSNAVNVTAFDKGMVLGVRRL